MIKTAQSLKNLELRARDGVLGKVKDLYVDDEHWTLRYLVVETGTWLNSRKVLVAMSVVDAPDWEASLLPVNLTQDQVRNSPSLDTERAVNREDEENLRIHYGWPAYWTGTGYPGGVMAGPLPMVEAPVLPPVPATAQAALTANPAVRTAPHGDPHLRRVGAVQGYRLEATDGAIGHIDDLLLDDLTWTVRYLVIDPRNWLPGSKVVVSPDWISSVSWSRSRVYIDLTREAIKAAPTYEPDAPWDEDYIRSLGRFPSESLPAGEK
jgi:PRC-barrel domain.